jgi:hypothetical protein
VAICLIYPAPPQALFFVADGRVLINPGRAARIFVWRSERNLEGNRS